MGFISSIAFSFWRFMEIITLIPTLGMLAFFVHQYTIRNQLTPGSILTLFIVSVLACAWAIATWFRLSSTKRSALFVSFIDLCFVGAFIAGVYELRGIAKANCTTLKDNGPAYVSVGTNGVSGSNGLDLNTNKYCAMQKASFAFGIMNCIFFFITAFLLLFMRNREEVVVKESYSRRRSHDSRYVLYLVEHDYVGTFTNQCMQARTFTQWLTLRAQEL
ncbi:hypothetical protein MMC21_004541 [Puttea exsequens]|nr:hypothetical protein [Puttea exsequens]